MSEFKISFSSFSEYTTCGEKWRLKRLEKVDLPDPPAPWTILGNTYHKAVELWEADARIGDMASLYRDAWDLEMMDAVDTQPDFTQWASSPRTKDVQKELETAFSNGLTQACNYAIRAEREAEDWHVVHAELPFEIPMQIGTHEVIVRGYIDQIRDWNGALVALDLKTGSQDNTDMRQPMLYAWAASKVLGEEVKFGRLFYSKLDEVPRSGDKMGRYSEWYDATEYGDEYWHGQFEEMLAGIDARVFLPNVSKLCDRCEVKPACRAWNPKGLEPQNKEQ